MPHSSLEILLAGWFFALGGASGVSERRRLSAAVEDQPDRPGVALSVVQTADPLARQCAGAWLAPLARPLPRLRNADLLALSACGGRHCGDVPCGRNRGRSIPRGEPTAAHAIPVADGVVSARWASATWPGSSPTISSCCRRCWRPRWWSTTAIACRSE